MVGEFDVDRIVEITMIQVHIDVQKCDLGGEDVPSELDRIVAVETFKQLDEGVGTVGQRRISSIKFSQRLDFLRAE